MSENGGDKETSLQTKENDDDVIRRLWKKFQPKLWLSSMWRRVSIRLRLKDLKTFMRKNIVSVSISVALGLCCLLLKLGKSRCNVVPYSNLLMGIRNGSVTMVQFEENSRRIFYNTKLQSDTVVAPDNLLARKNKLTWDANNGGVLKLQEMFANLLRKLSKNQYSVPGLYSRVNVDIDKQDLLKNQVAVRGWQYSTILADAEYQGLVDLLKEKGTVFGVKPEPVVISMGRRILTTVLNQAPSWAMLLFIARGLGGGSSIARKPSKQHTVTFDDVEGVDAAKTELMEIVSCLQGDVNYKNLGAKLPTGVLLVGPPGTGKTLLARAVAQKAGVPFFITCASEFVELFVGRGASRIRDLFKEARKCAPSIIFIDELDAVGLRRGRGFNTEGDQTLNQLLTEMDGFESDKKVVVIAATNRAEMLDPALLRPGRFSRKVFVREPDEDGRRKILAVHFRGVPLEDDTNLICNLVASRTEGLVGADLANIVNEAALLAGRRGGKCVSRDDVMEAVERVKFEIDDRQPVPECYEEEGRENFPVEFISRIKELTQQDRMASLSR